MKRLVGIIVVVVVALLILCAAPVLADDGKGPPQYIRNYQNDSGCVITSSQSNDPPVNIRIYMPSHIAGSHPHGNYIYIDPTTSAAN